jgi:hypothetical protein
MQLPYDNEKDFIGIGLIASMPIIMVVNPSFPARTLAEYVEIARRPKSNLTYANAGKYPLLLINGCEYGNAFGPRYSQGEDWLVTPNKGAIAVLSNSSLGVDVLLKRYTEIWYSQLFAVAPAADQLSLGDILLRTEREFLFRHGLSSEHEAFLSQQVLLGDPALRILHPILR